MADSSLPITRARIYATDSSRDRVDRVDGPHRSPGDVDPAVRSRCRQAALTAVAKPRGTGRLLEAGAADRLAELTMPVDVVLGTLDSTDVLGAGERIATQAADARVHRIEDAAHSVNLDRPGAFAGVLGAAFLQRSNNSSA
jgi:pimeloyl-ACP methyl ester carboxylesterase